MAVFVREKSLNMFLMVYLKANSVLAVVLLAWRSLWVELSDHGLNLAIVSGELRGAPTRVLIDPVHADATVLPQVVQVWIICFSMDSILSAAKSCFDILVQATAKGLSGGVPLSSNLCYRTPEVS